VGELLDTLASSELSCAHGYSQPDYSFGITIVIQVDIIGVFKPTRCRQRTPVNMGIDNACDRDRMDVGYSSLGTLFLGCPERSRGQS